MSGRGFVAALFVTACSVRTSPPKRTSPELAPVGGSLASNSWAHSRAGVTLVHEGGTSTVSRYHAGGTLTAAISLAEGRTMSFCVIGSDAAGALSERANEEGWLEVFQNGTLVQAVALRDAFGKLTSPVYTTCTGTSIDDLWLVASYDGTGPMTLAHYNGSAWTQESVPLEKWSDQQVAVTDGFVWVSNWQTMVRRPHTGGTFETVDMDGEFVASDATQVAVLHDLVAPRGITIHSDTAVPRVLLDEELAIFDASGELWLLRIESDGATDHSLVGSSYDLWWVQLLLIGPDGSEFAHANMELPGNDTDFEAVHPALVVDGTSVGILWKGQLYSR